MYLHLNMQTVPDKERHSKNKTIYFNLDVSRIYTLSFNDVYTSTTPPKNYVMHPQSKIVSPFKYYFGCWISCGCNHWKSHDLLPQGQQFAESADGTKCCIPRAPKSRGIPAGARWGFSACRVWMAFTPACRRGLIARLLRQDDPEGSFCSCSRPAWSELQAWRGRQGPFEQRQELRSCNASGWKFQMW